MSENDLVNSSARAFLARLLAGREGRDNDNDNELGDVHVVRDLDRTLSLSDAELEALLHEGLVRGGG